MIERTFNERLIRWYLEHPAMDGEFQLPSLHLDNPNMLYLHCPNVGMFPCMKMGMVASCHAAVLPEARGKKAVMAGRAVIEWLRANTDAVVVATRVKHSNLQAKRYNRMVDMEWVKNDSQYAHYRYSLWAL